MMVYFLPIAWFFLFATSDAAEIILEEELEIIEILNLPDTFLFSTATSAYQVEGAWNISGKGENIWDRLTHTRPDLIKDRSNGDVATDEYHHYKDDLRIVKDIGFKLYRFSVSWSRLYPTGYVSDGVDQAGLRYYNQLIDQLLADGIQPMVTIYHWDLPQPLEDIGGWLNCNISTIYGDYARELFAFFGERVKWWVTINEPRTVSDGYGGNTFAPALNMHGTGEYESAHNILRAHAKAYRIYDKEFRARQGGKLSIVVSGFFNMPKNPDDPKDVKAAEVANLFAYGWFLDPIYKGDYPAIMRTTIDRNSKLEGRKHSRLPYFTKEEMEELKGSADFMGVNHYTTYAVEPGLTGERPSWARDSGVTLTAFPWAPTTACDWLQVIPGGMRAHLRWISERYGGPDIFVTECGYCATKELNDRDRISYYKEYLRSMIAGMDAGEYTVIGFTAWSLIDNFEWNNGYTVKFGLIQVDFDSPKRTRIWKLSAKFFKKLLQHFYSNSRIST